MSTLGNFLQSVGARPLANGEYTFDSCWRCGGKQCTYFNIDKMVGVCHKCPRPIYLNTIAMELAGILPKDVQQYIEDHAVDERRKMGFREAMLDGLLGTPLQASTELHSVDWPEDFRTLEEGMHSVIGQKARSYLKGRGFTVGTLYELNFGYCASGKYANRVIIPFYEDGKLVYWQARDFTGLKPVEEKVLNPPSGWTRHGKSDVLFNYDIARQYATVVMTESWGSSLAVGRPAIAINGKSMSDVQLEKITSLMAETIVVLLDAGTQVESWKIAARLHSAQKRVIVCDLPNGDPNEVSNHVRLATLRSGLPYSAEDHIRQMALGRWG